LALEANALSPRDLFGGKAHYEIPAFQRPYVWSEEDQWAPLWDDVVRVAEDYVVAKLVDPDAIPEGHHFLGAVVYESRRPVAGDVTRHDVIDGQQRMTTIQLLLDAVQEVVECRGHADVAESLGGLILNTATKFIGKRERFKLWPSQADRSAFEYAMEQAGEWSGEHRIIDAHRFFKQEAERWIGGVPDEDGVIPPGDEALRVEALSSTLEDRLILVAINLAGHDDAQLIFETLNDRGTPLLKADLIKNWVFRKGERIGADVTAWADRRWAEFDGVWWREEIRQGRLNRSRIDIFLQYWLTMRRQEELKAEHTFRVFVDYAEPRMDTVAAADGLLAELRRDADTYRNLAQLDENTPEGRYYSRIIERLELAVTTPVFLWLLSKNHGVPVDQRRTGLEALESWVIRRTLLRMPTKDMNKFAVATLKMLDAAKPEHAGEQLVTFLSKQTAETRIWPSDARLTASLLSIRLYGNLRQDRLRVVLGAVEQHWRGQNSMYEAVALPPGLEIEHVMPQAWRTHWDPEPRLTPEAAAERDAIINTIGNLTLVTKSLNGSLSNRPWSDTDASGLTEGGLPGVGKRRLLEKFSLLVLNKEILDSHVDAWTEEDVRERSGALATAICEVWPGPDLEVHEAASEAAAALPIGELDAEPWSDDDVERLAKEAGESMRTVLDTLSAEPGKRWRNADFLAAGVFQSARHAPAALGALTLKARGSFGRTNPPVEYAKVGSDWCWAVNEEFATRWKTARGRRS
jgi:hypothetical protein